MWAPSVSIQVQLSVLVCVYKNFVAFLANVVASTVSPPVKKSPIVAWNDEADSRVSVLVSPDPKLTC
jgi:hypothetical protein